MQLTAPPSVRSQVVMCVLFETQRGTRIRARALRKEESANITSSDRWTVVVAIASS